MCIKINGSTTNPETSQFSWPPRDGHTLGGSGHDTSPLNLYVPFVTHKNWPRIWSTRKPFSWMKHWLREPFAIKDCFCLSYGWQPKKSEKERPLNLKISLMNEFMSFKRIYHENYLPWRELSIRSTYFMALLSLTRSPIIAIQRKSRSYKGRWIS